MGTAMMTPPTGPAAEPTAELFRALGDPVRLAIVEHLSSGGEATVNELAERFPITLQAVSRHIKVLESAGLVRQRRAGRQRPVRLHRPSVAAASGWLANRLGLLDASYHRLDDVLAELQHDTPGQPPSPTGERGSTEP